MKKHSRILTLFMIIAFIFVFSGIAQQVEGTVICPVSGKEIKKTEAKASYEYQGKMYYFCCKKCKEKFMKNPEKYLQKEVYTCPMHPDVKSDKPGKCPKCGMKMEKKMMAKEHMHAHMKAKEGMSCPIMNFAQCKDVEVKVENLENGVAIKITSKNAEVAKKIQEKIAKMKACCSKKNRRM